MTKDKIDVKIGSEDMVFWEEVKKKTTEEIKTMTKMVKFNEAILEMAKEKYSEAEKLFSKL